MKGIHPKTCIHHIYMDRTIPHVRQPQKRMNPGLKDIVKEELQKLLNAGFIYPIFDSKQVSPLVVVPKKAIGKWLIFLDFRYLNKATLKYYFPFPFIDQVLDTLSGKQYFSFLHGYSGYNQILIEPKDQENTTFTFHWGHILIEFFHLAYVMHLPLFSEQSQEFFSILYMNLWRYTWMILHPMVIDFKRLLTTSRRS